MERPLAIVAGPLLASMVGCTSVDAGYWGRLIPVRGRLINQQQTAIAGCVVIVHAHQPEPATQPTNGGTVTDNAGRFEQSVSIGRPWRYSKFLGIIPIGATEPDEQQLGQVFVTVELPAGHWKTISVPAASSTGLSPVDLGDVVASP